MPGYARYKPSEAKFELKKLALPGVYVVKVTDEKTLQATTLVLGSDLDAIVKTSRDQLLVFAQDMKTGKGRAGARVLVSEGGQIVLDAATGADGVLLARLETAPGLERPADLSAAGWPERRRLGTGSAGSGRPGFNRTRLYLHGSPRLSPRPQGLRSAAWSAKSRSASTPTCPRQSIASKWPTAAAG